MRECNKKINLNIKTVYQKKDECGMACLKMVLDYYKINSTMDRLIKETSSNSLKSADWYFRMGITAIDYGLNAEIITYSTRIFDSTWFDFSPDKLLSKLEKEYTYFKKNKKDKWTTEEAKQAVEFLKKGGRINFSTLTHRLFTKYLQNNIPLIAPINANIVFPSNKRMVNNISDDVKGASFGHVVLISGISNSRVLINEPGGDVMKLNKKGTCLVESSIIIEAVLRGDMHLLAIYK